MRPDRSTNEVRRRLDELAKGRKVTLAALSRMVGKQPYYFSTFVREGRPARLDHRDIIDLSTFFGVDPWELGKRWGD